MLKTIWKSFMDNKIDKLIYDDDITRSISNEIIPVLKESNKRTSA